MKVVLNWGRRYSLWVFNFGLACCAIEFIAASMARHDFIRLGVIPFAPGPAPGRPDGRLRHGHGQDGARREAAVRADAGAEVRHLLRRLLQLRRPVLGLVLRDQGRRPDHPGRRVRARAARPAPRRCCRASSSSRRRSRASRWRERYARGAAPVASAAALSSGLVAPPAADARCGWRVRTAGESGEPVTGERGVTDGRLAAPTPADELFGDGRHGRGGVRPADRRRARRRPGSRALRDRPRRAGLHLLRLAERGRRAGHRASGSARTSWPLACRPRARGCCCAPPCRTRRPSCPPRPASTRARPGTSARRTRCSASTSPATPDLVPLLLPEGFEGHPLRKDFVLAARVAKAWPGAKEPGESGRTAAPSAARCCRRACPTRTNGARSRASCPPAPAARRRAPARPRGTRRAPGPGAPGRRARARPASARRQPAPAEPMRRQRPAAPQPVGQRGLGEPARGRGQAGRTAPGAGARRRPGSAPPGRRPTPEPAAQPRPGPGPRPRARRAARRRNQPAGAGPAAPRRRAAAGPAGSGPERRDGPGGPRRRPRRGAPAAGRQDDERRRRRRAGRRTRRRGRRTEEARERRARRRPAAARRPRRLPRCSRCSSGRPSTRSWPTCRAASARCTPAASTAGPSSSPTA